MTIRIHNIINSHSLQTGGAERLVRQLHLGLTQTGRSSQLVELLQSDDPPNASTSLGAQKAYSIQALYRLFVYLRKEVRAGDIVHAHLSPTIFYCAAFKWLMPRRFKLITTEHNSQNNRRSSWIGRLLDAWLYRTVDHIACISQGTQDALIDWQPGTESKSSVIYNGISLKSHERTSQSQQNTKVRIASVGRLHEQKNYSVAIEAIALLKESAPGTCSFEYLIAGEGVLRAQLQDLITKRQLNDEVKLLGHISNIPEWLLTADIFLIPSKWEGFGLAAVEAMHAGLPVIASDVAGLNELIRGKELVGHLINPKDPHAICAALQNLMQKPELRAQFGAAARERAKDFDIEKMVEAYCRLYDQIGATSQPYV